MNNPGMHRYNIYRNDNDCLVGEVIAKDNNEAVSAFTSIFNVHRFEALFKGNGIYADWADENQGPMVKSYIS